MLTSDEAIAWIQLELIPLPSVENELSQLMLWWNPETRQIVGEGAESVLNIVQEASDLGVLEPSPERGMASFELVDPLSRPSELAAILAQYFWVIPTPVRTIDVLALNNHFSSLQ